MKTEKLSLTRRSAEPKLRIKVTVITKQLPKIETKKKK